MNAPRQKARWSAEKRAAKGKNPKRRGGFEAPASGALNRKQRRALQFGDAPKTQARTDERSEGRQDDRRGNRDERPSRGSDDRYSNRDDRYGNRRDDRSGGRDDRYSNRGRDDRSSNRGRDDRFGNRDDRFGNRQSDRYQGRDDRRQDDRRGDRFDGRRDDRFQGRRDDRFSNRDRDDRYSNRDRDDRFGNRRDDRFQGRDDRYSNRDRDDRPANRERGEGYQGRRDDRGFRGDRRASDRPHFDTRRNYEPRGREDRRRDDRRRDDRRRDDRQGFEAQSFDDADQMSWNATTVEAAQGDVASGFFELGVAEPMVRVLASQGITEPFPIQSATIGDALAGRDVLGRGRTGSGKTLAFGLPLLTRLSEGTPVGSPRAMILTPTRELALQIADNLSPLAAAVGIDLTLIAGGMSYGPQLRAFERGVDVVVATPGRLIDLLEQGAADLSQVEITVLDEADHMADLGFMTDVRTLLDATGDGQRLLFSATLDAAVDQLVKRYLNDPVTREVDSEKASVTTMVHRPLLVKPHHKNQVTAEIANREGRTVLFARTQMGTDRIAGQLRDAGVMAGALHGGLTQGARARILAAFRDGTVPVLVATDVAARGIHVDDVTLVLQVDPPHDSKDYLHRAGRTARAGHEGVVATVVLPHQRKLARRLLGQAGVNAEPLDVEPGTPELRDATGARPTSGVSIAEEDYQRLIAPKQQQRRRPDGQRGRGGYRPNRRGPRY